jgi:hypothetical protein
MQFKVDQDVVAGLDRDGFGGDGRLQAIYDVRPDSASRLTP